MSEWVDSTLGQVCRDGGVIQTGPFGSQLHAEDYASHGVPVVMPTDIRDGRISDTQVARIRDSDVERLARHKLQPGDIVYSRRGDITRCALVTDREAGWLCGTGCLLVRPGSDVDYRWLYYWLSAPWTHRWLYGHAVGATMLNLNTGILSALPVSVPRINEQRRITGVLGALDDLIENNRRLARALEDQILTLFTQEGFDREPDRESLSLSELVDVNPKLPKPVGDAPYVDMSALPTDSSRIGTVTRRPATGGARFQNGDTLLARLTPCLENGKAAFVDLLAPDEIAVGSTEFLVLRDRGTLGPHWPYALVRSERFRDNAIRHMNGSSGRQRCSAGSAETYRLVPPAPDAVDRFRISAASAFDAIGSLNDEVDDLTRARDELLPLLMSGRVRVREVA